MKKYEDHIKRPENCYLRFQKSIGEKVRTMLGVSRGSWKKKVGEIWRSMSTEEKSPYIQEAARIYEKHKKDFPHYVYHPIRTRKQATRSSRPSLDAANAVVGHAAFLEKQIKSQSSVVFPVMLTDESSSKIRHDIDSGTTAYSMLKWEPVRVDCLDDNDAQMPLNPSSSTISAFDACRRHRDVSDVSSITSPLTSSNCSALLQFETEGMPLIGSESFQSHPKDISAMPMKDLSTRVNNGYVCAECAEDSPALLGCRPSPSVAMSSTSGTPFSYDISAPFPMPRFEPRLQKALCSVLGLDLNAPIPTLSYSSDPAEYSDYYESYAPGLGSDYTTSPSSTMSLLSTPSATYDISLPLATFPRGQPTYPAADPYTHGISLHHELHQAAACIGKLYNLPSCVNEQTTAKLLAENWSILDSGSDSNREQVPLGLFDESINDLFESFNTSSSGLGGRERGI